MCVNMGMKCVFSNNLLKHRGVIHIRINVTIPKLYDHYQCISLDSLILYVLLMKLKNSGEIYHFLSLFSNTLCILPA